MDDLKVLNFYNANNKNLVKSFNNNIDSSLNVKLDYIVSINAEVKYSYEFNGTTVEGNITDKNNTLLFAIPSDLFSEVNAGYYTFNLTINVTPEN